MKPKVFIGSSAEAQDVADAIQRGLESEAESRVWANGVFRLSETLREGLTSALEHSDFAIFVFASDDLVQVRDQSLAAPRDNVVYEAGLFAGRLGFQRCFIAVPSDNRVKLPTDLLGTVVGKYESQGGIDLMTAVRPFCDQVLDKIREIGAAHAGERHDRLLELIVSFERLEWVTDPAQRTAQMRHLVNDMRLLQSDFLVNKRELLGLHRVGGQLALACAIRTQPEMGDDKLILRMDRALISNGFSQLLVLDAAVTLKDRLHITSDQISQLRSWFERLPNPADSFNLQLESFRTP